MAVRRRQIAHQPDTLELLPLALSRPKEALARARAVLAADPDPYHASIAHQTIGIVLREFGDVGEAIREVRTALRLAAKAGSSQREADVLATLGLALVFAGRTSSGLAAFDRAVRQSSGPLAGRVLMRLALALWTLGRHQDALEALRPAVTVLRRAGDTIWEARALTARAFVHLALGSVDRGTVDIARAERLFAAAGQEYESAVATHNHGVIAFRSGDLPAALDFLDAAAGRYDLLGAEVPDLSIDRCAVLLAAGLSRDALQEADRAIRGLEQGRGQATKRAELLLVAAESALAAADPRAALERAGAAHRLFCAQQRPWWRAHARLVLVRARFAAGMVSGQLLRQAARTAAELDALHAGEASQAHLLAGRTALALARFQEADRHLAIAAKARRRGPVLSRAGGWLAEALRAEAVAGPRQVLNACRQGLDLLDEHRDTLGASELRVQATAHGAELAALAQRQALRAGAPRRLLAWSERWRATALAIPPVRPPDDHQLQGELVALREITRGLEDASARGAPTAAFQRERQRLEGGIRARALRTRGAGHRRFEFQVEPLLEEVGAAHLVQIVEIDGNLHALVCGGGRVRRFPAGRAEEAAGELDFARFGLRRLAYNRPVGRPEAAVAQLEATGRRLERAFLGQAARHLGSGPVVVVPPARLHAVPWALLPSFRDRVLSLAPSAQVWLRARRAIPPTRRTVVLVRGPDLGTGGAEVPALAETYDDMTVLGQGTATAQRVLAAIDGAWLVHIAAHGRFRASSPLFSALHLDDGPLTVHDLERLRRAPHRLVLSSCDAGISAPAGADELLGLTSSLVPLGTVGIVASVLPVNDAAAVPLMLALHQRLRAGASLAESLRDARLELPADPVRAATGWSFVALGAG